MTVSDAFLIVLTRIAYDKALPFEPQAPNEATVAAMREARAGRLESTTLDDLRAVLHADD